MGSHALYLVRMDVAHDHEAEFNEVYDREHVPALTGVPGVRRGEPLPEPLAHRAPVHRRLRDGQPRGLRERGLEGGRRLRPVGQGHPPRTP